MYTGEIFHLDKVVKTWEQYSGTRRTVHYKFWIDSNNCNLPKS